MTNKEYKKLPVGDRVKNARPIATVIDRTNFAVTVETLLGQLCKEAITDVLDVANIFYLKSDSKKALIARAVFSVQLRAGREVIQNVNVSPRLDRINRIKEAMEAV